MFDKLSAAGRALSIAAAALLLAPGQGVEVFGTRILVLDLAGILLLGAVALASWRARRPVPLPA